MSKSNKSKKKVVPDDPGSAKVMTLRNFTDLADVMRESGKLTEAEELYRTGLEGRVRLLGKDHPESLMCMHNLALVLEARRNFASAEETFRNCLAARERVLGPHDLTTLQTAFCLADMLRKLGRLDEALVLFSFTHKAYAEVCGPRHRNTILAKKRVESVNKQQQGGICVLL